MATGGSDPCESPLKRPKTEPTTPTAVKEEPTATASEELKAHLDSSVRVAVPGLGGMALAFYNENVYLYNDSAESTLTMKAGAVVAQFQRGKWVSGFQNLPEASKSTCIPFCLTGSQDLVMVGPQVSTLGNVVETARMKDPLTAKVAYHELVERSVPGEQYAFTATVKHEHAWKSEPYDVMPDAGSLVTKSCAGWVSHNKWDHPATALTWQMKWTQKGLTPVRPLVILKCDRTFPPRGYIQF